MGLKNANVPELAAKRAELIPRGVATANRFFVAKAEGAVVWDETGKEYIDFAGGIGVLNVGHLHPKVTEAVREQLGRFAHMCVQVAAYDKYIEVAERLHAVVPGDFPKKTFLATTGAEAVENGIKIARAYTGRSAVVAFSGAFHGRTLLGMSLTGKVDPYRARFGPLAPEIYHAPYPYEYRGWTTERALEALQYLFHTEISPKEVAAVIIEPVLGEGGFVPAPPEFLQRLYEITREHGIVFIADEIQTGFGRTGRWFAMEHAGVAADLTLAAKSLAGGLPLSAVVGRADVMDGPGPGGLGGTYGGNPLACAAALGVFEAFESDRLLERAVRVGARLEAGLKELAARFPAIGDVRGVGPMQAIELVKDPETREPDAALTDYVRDCAEEAGLVLVKAGLYGNVLRFLPPLVVTDEQIDKALAIIADGLEKGLAAR